MKGKLFLTISIFLLISTITVIPIQALTFIHSSTCLSCTRYGLLIVVVRDSDGNRVSGATVTVKDPDDNFVKSGTTRRYGMYVTVLPRGDYYVVAEKDGLIAESDVFSLRYFKRVVLTFESSCTPEPEICDGLDNDCDGQVDEDFPSLGQSCEVGIGECKATGTYVCTVDGTGTECNAILGQPTPEVCDGLDNDCDGEIDEDRPSCYDVTIHVEENSGDSLSGAKVTIYDGTGTTPVTDTKTTDGNGDAQFCLSNGEYMIQVVLIDEVWGKVIVSGAPVEVTITL